MNIVVALEFLEKVRQEHGDNVTLVASKTRDSVPHGVTGFWVAPESGEVRIAVPRLP